MVLRIWGESATRRGRGTMAYPPSPSSGVNATRPGAIQGVTAPARTIDTKRKRFRLGLFRRRRCPGARRTCHCDAAVTCCYCRTSVASIPEWCPAPSSTGAVRAVGFQANGHRSVRLQAAHTARAPCHPKDRQREMQRSRAQETTAVSLPQESLPLIAGCCRSIGQESRRCAGHRNAALPKIHPRRHRP